MCQKQKMHLVKHKMTEDTGVLLICHLVTAGLKNTYSQTYSRRKQVICPHADKQVCKQICRQCSTVTNISKSKHMPASKSHLLQLHTELPLQTTVNSMCLMQHYLTIICLILRVRAAENLTESRKY